MAPTPRRVGLQSPLRSQEGARLRPNTVTRRRIEPEMDRGGVFSHDECTRADSDVGSWAVDLWLRDSISVQSYPSTHDRIPRRRQIAFLRIQFVRGQSAQDADMGLCSRVNRLAHNRNSDFQESDIIHQFLRPDSAITFIPRRCRVWPIGTKPRRVLASIRGRCATDSREPDQTYRPAASQSSTDSSSFTSLPLPVCLRQRSGGT